jgi:hypothetical protein
VLERVTIYQASQRLGISESAVRQRIHRGTVESGKDENGRLVVYLPSNDANDTKDNGDTTTVMQDYIITLKSQIESLERDKEALERDKEHYREESARKDHIIMAITQRIPELEAPTDERESVVPPSDESPEGDVPQQSHRLSWWQRWFGAEPS